MKTDLYTKVILTIIAGVLIVILIKPIMKSSPVQALNEEKFAHVQFQPLRPINEFGDPTLYFFNTRTGDIWLYNINSNRVEHRVRLVELGKNLMR